jgi:hypothetical protein
MPANTPPSQPPNRPQGAATPPPRPPVTPPAPHPAPKPQTPPPAASGTVLSDQPTHIPDVPAKEPETYPPPKDFHLAEPGSKDYVAGQPVDEEELAETEEAAKANADPDKQTHSPHYNDPKAKK